MMEVKAKCQQLLENHAVEPNSSLGQAIKYMLKHWCGLTEFLRTPGVPLDNNFLEGQLRLAVLNRRNWLFYKTLIGALVGDVITSTIKTCDANNKNSFDYLVWVQKNAEDVRKNPGNYLPWHFNPNSS